MKAVALLLPLALLTALASPAPAQMEVTFVGNNGVMLSAGGDSVLIDSLFTHTDPFWTRLPTAGRTALLRAESPFDNVRWSLTTHNHPDHFNAQAVRVFSGNSPETQFILSPQARGSVADVTSVVTIDVPFQNGSSTVTSPGIEIEIFHMEHFDQFGNDFSRVQDYTYLVTMGGVKLLHLGDVDYIPENFAAFDFPSRGIDGVVIPTFNTLLTSANRQVILDQVAPRHIFATHLRAGQLEQEAANVRALYPEATIFTESFQSFTIQPVPEPSGLLLVAGAAGLAACRRFSC
ncbi:MBL fold metallo-hydrolase [Botrimarina hoheduenensis]|nr:MBL fold metallo-hydrolase [Botrimarina hoheduenensis]